MRGLYWSAAAGMLALLGGCEPEAGGNAADNAAAANARVSAEGKAEDGKLTIKAPGLDIGLSIPEGLARQARVNSDSEVIYPGAKIAGIHVAGGESGGGEVEMRFTTPDAVEKVVAWYRDPARGQGFALEVVVREGNGFVVSGTQTGDKHGFRATLTPASGGGTEGRVLLRESGGA